MKNTNMVNKFMRKIEALCYEKEHKTIAILGKKREAFFAANTEKIYKTIPAIIKYRLIKFGCKCKLKILRFNIHKFIILCT